MPVTNLPLGARGIFCDATMFGFPNGTWTLTRVAGGDYNQLKTAGAATTNPYLNISKAIARIQAGSVNAPLGTELQSGGLLTGFDLFYSIATAALTSLTPTLYQTTYVNNVADSVNASPGGTITPTTLLAATPTAISATPVATQANPYSVRYALASPYIVGKNVADVADFLELAIVDPGTSVFALIGVGLLFNDNR